MEIDVLREIVMLAEKRSYAVAADALFISTSTLSRHVTALERQLGVSLFIRTSRNVQLSRYGEMLLPFARKLMQVEDEYLEKLEQAKRLDGAGLRVGAYYGLAAHGIMTQIAKFVSTNQDVPLTIENEGNGRLLERLKTGRYDLIFMQAESPCVEDGFCRLTVAVDTLVAVLPAEHLLAQAESVRLTQLRDETFLMQQMYSVPHRLAMDAFQRAGYTPKIARPQITGVGILELVEQGVGIALTQAAIARQQHCGGVALIPLEPPERVWINLVWNPETISEIGKSFVAHFRDYTQGKKNF